MYFFLIHDPGTLLLDGADPLGLYRMCGSTICSLTQAFSQFLLSPSATFFPSCPPAVTGLDTLVETDPSCQDLPRCGLLGQDH